VTGKLVTKTGEQFCGVDGSGVDLRRGWFSLWKKEHDYLERESFTCCVRYCGDWADRGAHIWIKSD